METDFLIKLEYWNGNWIFKEKVDWFKICMLHNFFLYHYFDVKWWANIKEKNWNA